MAPLPPPDPELELPPIHLRLHPITDPGVVHFLETLGPKCGELFASHCRTIIAALYNVPRGANLASSSESSTSHPEAFPTIHSVTILIRPMDGVAYTTGGTVDPAAKEVHCSAAYFGRSNLHEISGVLIHELVHVWQRNGEGTVPGGFIEGLADYVRLKAGLGAKHWRKSKPERDQPWDAGYERTGWFLEWVEDHTPKAKGWLKRVNMRLAKEKWGDWVWGEAGAQNAEELWKAYVKSFDGEESTAPGEGPPPAKPTHAVGS